MGRNKNDYARLKQEADIGAVIQYLGLEVHQKGSAYFIQCPLPEHNDQHPTNCYFKEGWNNVYCNVCNKAVNAIDLIMLVTGMDYGEAADTLWELEGRPDWYYAKRSIQRESEFRISKEDAELIGLHYPGRILSAVNITNTKDSKRYTYLPSFPDEYIACKPEHLTWRDFMSEQQYRVICANKAREKRISCILSAKQCTGDLHTSFLEMALRCADVENASIPLKNKAAA